MSTADDFAQRIAARRKALGMSQTAFSRRMTDAGFPWHQMTVARTEAGERPVRLDEAIAISRILAVPLVDDGEIAAGLADELTAARNTITALERRVAELERENRQAASQIARLEDVVDQVKAAVR